MGGSRWRGRWCGVGVLLLVLLTFLVGPGLTYLQEEEFTRHQWVLCRNRSIKNYNLGYTGIVERNDKRGRFDFKFYAEKERLKAAVYNSLCPSGQCELDTVTFNYVCIPLPGEFNESSSTVPRLTTLALPILHILLFPD